MSLIFQELGWKVPEELIAECSALFVHKVITTQKPQSLYNEIRLPRSRLAGQTTTKTAAATNRLARTGLYTAVKNYNRIPANLKMLNPRQLKKKLKKLSLMKKPP